MRTSRALRPLLALCVAATFPFQSLAAELSAELRDALARDEGPVRVMVIARQARDEGAFVSVMSASPTARRRDRATRATARIRDILANPAGGFGLMGAPEIPSADLWALNAVVADVDAATAEALAADPSVARIVMDRHVQILDDQAAAMADEPDVLWGLKKVGTAEVRRRGFTGEGVRVGVIDTGIQADHPELEGKVERFVDLSQMTVEDGKIVGNPSFEPYDDNGHGTHCAGTIAGNRVGIAPDARLVIAKGMGGEGGGSVVGLLLSMQWMLDPDQDPTTDDAPDIVSNSWGINVEILKENVGLFRELVVAWKEAGIVPVFASGNDGPGTAAAPAVYPEAFAVGATTHTDAAAHFSTGARIKLKDGLLVKPDIAAPGAAIVSSYPGSKYARLDGTSMACPLVAGALAVALEAFPDANNDQLQRAFEKGALDLGEAGKDPRFGHGRLDVPKALGFLEATFGAPRAMAD